MGGRRHVSVIFKWNWGLPYVKRSADEWLWTGHVETVGERSNKKDLSASTVTILSVVNISWAGPWTSQCHQRVNHRDGHHTANRSSWNFAFRDYGLDNKRLIVSWRSWRRLQWHLWWFGIFKLKSRDKISQIRSLFSCLPLPAFIIPMIS